MSVRCERTYCRQPAAWLVYLTLVCDRHLAGAIRDAFGENIIIRHDGTTVRTMPGSREGRS